MIIREATDKDIPAILNVLKASLGEVSSKKTAEIWRYKHLENPFGQSLILLAEENKELIGVRAFMRWQWQRGNKTFFSFRAVDTATHPNHQGKGIFKKLTLKALEIARSQNNHFVFNTPNSQSRPGYLKMGWTAVSKIKVHLIPVNPILWMSKNENQIYFHNFNSAITKNILINHNRRLSSYNKLFTPKTVSFLDWRYLKNPLQNYRVFGSDRIFVAAYLKKINNVRELRISELIYSTESDISELKKIIKIWAKEFRAHYIGYNSPDSLKLSFLEISGTFGPILTVRGLNSADDYYDIGSWAYSLGDLELF